MHVESGNHRNEQCTIDMIFASSHTFEHNTCFFFFFFFCRYVDKPFNKSKTEVGLAVRKKTKKAVVTKMPLIEPNYYRKAE